MTKGQLVKSSERSFPAHMTGALVPYDQFGDFRREQVTSYSMILRRHAKAIRLILLASLIASVLISLIMPPLYRSKAVVEVFSVNNDFLNNKDVAPNVSSDASMDSYLDTQTRLLKSDVVTDRVVASLLQHPEKYKDSGSLLSRLTQRTGAREFKDQDLESDIRKTLKHLQVKPEGSSTLISITVAGPSAQLAADAANAVATEHIAALQESRVAMANQTTDFLTAQLHSLRTKLQQSENDLQAYAKKTGLIFTSDTDRESVDADKLRQVQSDLEKAESDRADKQSQMELLDSAQADSLPKVLDDGSLQAEEAKLADLKQQYASLTELYTPNHYKVKTIQSQIQAVEASIKQKRSHVVDRVRNDYRAAVRREALQKKEYDRQLALVTDQSSKQVTYNLLKREVDANRDLYQSMLQKIREAGVVAALRASNIRIVDNAKPASLPYQPNTILNVSIGLLAGCVLSIIFVLTRERFDASIRSAGQASRTLQIRELAIVPSARSDIRTQIVSASGRRSPIMRALLSKNSPANSPELSKRLVRSWNTTASAVAESFRSAVTSILLWGRDSQTQNKVLVVTSAHPNAGKTTSVLNLGLGLAESGRNVLLIDADLRLPRLGSIFGLESALGLSNILSKGFDPKSVSEAICQTEHGGLHVLPSGPRYSNVTELLHGDALNSLMKYLRSQYEFILIDSPPVFPFTDSRLLAQHADAVVLVIRAGSTKVEQISSVQDCFVQDGIEILGTILNHWDANVEDPSYLNSYGKYANAFHRTARSYAPSVGNTNGRRGRLS